MNSNSKGIARAFPTGRLSIVAAVNHLGKNAKWPERNRRLKRHLGDKAQWEAPHGKLSSLHPVEQLLHAGGERGLVAAADHGDALTRLEPRHRRHVGSAVPFATRKQ